jgi:large subunit ribosomal protein L15
MIHKRSKSSRFRGSGSHGRGSINWRGKGNKGGAGNAGSGKRADCKKPSYWKLPEGRNGFVPKGQILKINAINVKRVQELIDNKVLKEENGVYDLGKIGYNKLLSKGNIEKGIKIKVLKASENVVASIKEAGGDVILG